MFNYYPLSKWVLTNVYLTNNSKSGAVKNIPARSLNKLAARGKKQSHGQWQAHLTNNSNVYLTNISKSGAVKTYPARSLNKLAARGKRQSCGQWQAQHSG